MLATNPAPVFVHRLPRFWFVLPMTLPTIRFGDIGSNDGLAERLQGVIAVVSLVGDRLDRSLRVHPFAHLFIISGAGDLGDMLTRLGKGFQDRCRVARVARGDRHCHHRACFQIHRMLGLVGQVRASVLQLGNARLRVVRIDPILIRSLVGSLTIELRQLLPCGRSNPRFLRQPPEKLLIVLARLPSHNRTQGRVRLQGRGIDAHRLPLQQALFRQELQHPAEHRLMGFHVDQPSGAGDRRVVGRHLVQPRSQKTAQRQRVRRPPCDATLAVDAFKIPDEQQTEVPPRRQTRPPHSLRVEPGALLFHPFVKAALFQQSVQLFVKRMRYRPRQVCLCDPNRLLSSLPRFSAHCHARSLLPTVVNHSTIYDENPDLHHGLLGVNDRDSTECGGGNPTATGTATDGSGITMTVTSTPSASVTLRNGEKIAPGLTTGGSTSSGGPQTDSNGNQITSTINGSITTFFDTLSSTTAVLTIDATIATSVLYEYTSPANTTANVTASYVTYNVQTAFGCGINEYGPIQNSLVDRITLPDSSYYQFTYEVTPQDTHTPRYVTGRIASVRLPTGGTISYTYQGGDTGQGIFCADGSTAGFDRTTPDGTWQYRRTGTSPNYTTTITTPIDPNTGQTNTTVINFQGEFETQRQIYQGAATGTPLVNVTTCYNGTPASPCPGTAVATPFSQITVLRSLNGGSQSRVDTQYNGYGLVTEKDEYNFGVTTPARKTSVSYGSYNAGTDTCTDLSNNIVDRACKVTVTDGAGNLKAETTHGYDETVVQSSGVTIQHVSVTGSRGNLTTVSTYTTASAKLTRTFKNYDTGNVY